MEDQVLVSRGCQYFNVSISVESQSNSFLEERKLLFQPSFWSYPVCSAVVGRAGLFLLLSRRSWATLSPGCIPVHRWNERDGTAVFYH